MSAEERDVLVRILEPRRPVVVRIQPRSTPVRDLDDDEHAILPPGPEKNRGASRADDFDRGAFGISDRRRDARTQEEHGEHDEGFHGATLPKGMLTPPI